MKLPDAVAEAVQAHGGLAGTGPVVRVVCSACSRRTAGYALVPTHDACTSEDCRRWPALLVTTGRWSTNATAVRYGLVTFPNEGPRTVQETKVVHLPAPGQPGDPIGVHAACGHLVEIDLAAVADALAAGRAAVMGVPPVR